MVVVCGFSEMVGRRRVANLWEGVVEEGFGGFPFIYCLCLW